MPTLLRGAATEISGSVRCALGATQKVIAFFGQQPRLMLKCLGLGKHLAGCRIV